MGMKSLAQQAAPSSWMDTLIRAVKTFVFSLVGALLIAIPTDINGAQALLMSSAAPAVAIVANRILAWAASP